MSSKNKKSNPPKKITEYVYGTTSGNVDHLTFTVDGRDGKVSLGPNVTNAYSERSYERPKGPKVVSRVPQSSSGMYFDNNAALDEGYNKIFAVDTNYYEIEGVLVAATGVVSLHRSITIGPVDVIRGWRVASPTAAVFSKPTINPEKLGWMLAIEDLYRSEAILSSDKVGIIVDSFLGDLSSFNNRSMPIVEPWYLPQNITLMYASADASRNDVMNWAIRTADLLAKQCLQKFSDGDFGFDAALSGKYFAAVRFIRPNLVEGR